MARESVDLQNGSLLKKMLAFALPPMTTNALQLMFNAADIAIIGHFGTAHSLAAIGVTPYIVSFLLCFFSGLTVGTNVLASVSLGARDFKQTRRIVHTSIAVALIAGGVCLSICGSFYFIGGFMDVMGCSLRGLGKTLEPSLITLFGACGPRLLWIATYFQIPENHTLKTLYAAYPLSWGLTTVVLYAVYLPVRRKFPKESVKKAAA